MIRKTFTITILCLNKKNIQVFNFISYSVSDEVRNYEKLAPVKKTESGRNGQKHAKKFLAACSDKSVEVSAALLREIRFVRS